MSVLDLALAIASSAVRVATPLVLAATGETIAERAGVIDVGVEGIMLGGALAAFLATSASGSALVGAGAAVLAGLALGGILALFALALRADQVVTGLGLNLLAFGVAGTAYRLAVGATGGDVRVPELRPWGVPLLEKIPGAGPALFVQEPFAWLALALVVATAWVLSRSTWGIALRAVGDEPRAAEAAGVRVLRARALADAKQPR
jgi:simple sugar transport system permease protein